MEEWQLRVVIEKAELDIKIHKLEEFLNTEHARKNPYVPIQEQLLVAMGKYSRILEERINSFEEH